MSEPATQPRQTTAPPAQEQAPGQSEALQSTPTVEADRAANPDPAPTAEDEQEVAAQAAASTEVEVERETRQSAADEPAEAAPSEIEEAEPKIEEPPHDLTDVPATVINDADVRVRPGLAWRAIERLASGASAIVLQQAGGWYRISYGENLVGWIRTTALDLGDVDAAQVLEQPASPLIAEWQGEQYGVMGQSADGAEVRLLRIEEEESTIIGAPIDEVTLVDADIALEDLPILIGNETVVFPGDDFRVGQGKNLPSANEWMWLPWGWLLAHNDTHIWQWRPETDELEFIERPPGRAWLSPDGERLGIIACPRERERCHPVEDVLFLHLDGTKTTSLHELLIEEHGVGFQAAFGEPGLNDLAWLGGGRAVLLSLITRRHVLGQTAILFSGTGEPRLIRFGQPGAVDGRACTVDPPDFFSGPLPALTVDEVYIGWAYCWNEQAASVSGHLVFELGDETLRLEAPITSDDEQSVRDFFGSAANGDGLGAELEVSWSASRSRALVFDFEAGQIWMYDADDHGLSPVRDETDAMAPIFDLESSITITRDYFWHGDEAVAVLARWGYEWIVGAFLIDVAARVSSSVTRDYINKWACLEAGAWSPSGSLFQTAFSKSTFDGVGASYRGDWFSIDGTARTFNTDWQHNIVYSDGSPAGVLRASGYGPRSPPDHLAAWSLNGEWLAFGGHQERGKCVFGE